MLRYRHSCDLAIFSTPRLPVNIEKIDVTAVDYLHDVIEFCNERKKISPSEIHISELFPRNLHHLFDFTEVNGRNQAIIVADVSTNCDRLFRLDFEKASIQS